MPVVANNDTTVASEESDDADEVEEDDPLLLESGRVLADFIALNNRRVSAVDRRAPAR